jgi:hypothetical protein
MMEELPDSARTAIMVNCLQAEKTTFWIKNRLLAEDQIQSRWSSRTAELKQQLSSVFGPTPPPQPGLMDNLSSPNPQHNVAYLQPTPNLMNGPSVSGIDLYLEPPKTDLGLDQLSITRAGPSK